MLHLTKNMRANEDKDFANYLLDVGRGKVETHPEIGPDMIKIPEEFVSKSENIKQLCEEIYPNLATHVREGLTMRAEDPNWNHFVHERAIICPTNENVEEVNRTCLELMDGQPMVYYSFDKCLHKKDQTAYPTEFLNKITPSGTPTHVLVLKPGAPISLMRNLDPENGHVNGAQ